MSTLLVNEKYTAQLRFCSSLVYLSGITVLQYMETMVAISPLFFNSNIQARDPQPFVMHKISELFVSPP